MHPEWVGSVLFLSVRKHNLNALAWPFLSLLPTLHTMTVSLHVNPIKHTILNHVYINDVVKNATQRALE